MKKISWFWMIVVEILWLVLYFYILIKLPFYVYMNHIHLPEDCTSLETNVIVTDLVYGFHIEAERLIYSSQGAEAIESYIDENNTNYKSIVVGNFYESNAYDYDHDILIPSEKYPYKERDAENYILLHYNSGDNLYDIMFVLGIAVMAILYWLMHRVNRYLQKKTGNSEIQNSDSENEKNAFHALIHLWKYGDTKKY
ncbi:MAG: hypothetical protein K2K70_14525 [Lachnospiraceae bacterium]|nr:hypothetical protein [Lachnospiraceae bacterium]